MTDGGYTSRLLHREAGGVDIAAAEPRMELVRAKILEYRLEFMYNMDETGL